MADALVDIQADLRQRCDVEGWKVRWVGKQQLHLTLQFLGHLQPDVVRNLNASLTLPPRAAIGFTVAGLGAFPSPKRPRVLWAGIRDGADELTLLARDLAAALSDFEIEPPPNPFHPHITLGRIKHARGHASRVLEAFQPTIAGKMVASQLVLIQSQLAPDGPHYTPIATFALERGRPG